MKRLIALGAVLAAAFLLFFDAARTPQPLPADAPAKVFSAGRAMGDIAVMAAVPHPIGIAANAKVRDVLVARMTALGLTPRIQRAAARNVETYQGQTYVEGATVENVVGVLPGRDHALPALVIMAHYDSVAGSPGAADDMAGVGCALEVARALKALGTPARDLIVLITDGEEAGLLGAEAFFSADPLASHAGYILNMDTRGGGGRASMFQTGDGNGAAIALYGRVTAQPNANALAVFLYKHLPNDTDYTIAKAKGLPGLNYAFIGRQFDYHSPSSTVAALDQGSVQHMGDQVLAAAQGLAFAQTLPPTAPDAVYGSLLGRWLIAYPAWGGWVVLGAIAVLLALAAGRARRLAPLSGRQIARGAGATLLILASGALALHLTRHATGSGFGWIEGRALLARFAPFEVAMALAGLGALMLSLAGLYVGKIRLPAALLALFAGLAASALGGFDAVALGEGLAAAALCLLLFGAPGGLAETWLGLMLVAGLTALGLQIAAPTTAFIFAWPLAIAALCAALTAAGRERGPIRLLIALALSTLALAWIGDLVHSLMQALDIPELPILPLWLAALVLCPLIWPETGKGSARLTPGAALLVLGLAIALTLHLTSPWSPRHPRAAEPLYLVDQDQGRAYRISPFAPDPWAKAVLTADGGVLTRLPVPTLRRPAWAAAAPLVAVQKPDIRAAMGPDGRVALTVAGLAGDRLDMDLQVDTPVTDVRIDGVPVALFAHPGQDGHLGWQAADGLTLSFKPVGPGALKAGYAVYHPGWPATAKPLPPRPAAVMAWDKAGDTVVSGTVQARW